MFLHHTMPDPDLIRAARRSSSHLLHIMADRLEVRSVQIERVRAALGELPAAERARFADIFMSKD